MKTQEQINAYFREYRRKNRDKMRAYNREYNKKWRHKNGYHNELNWALKYPEKVAAERKLLSAMRDNLIKRKPCETCGENKSDAHHDDYSKPFSVRWLCRVHHVEFHLNNTYIKKTKTYRKKELYTTR